MLLKLNLNYVIKIFLSYILLIPENELIQLKSKLRNKCHKCNKTKVPYKYQDIIANLTYNKRIKILKQDEGRGAVIINSSKYTEKCLGILENDQFPKANKNFCDPSS